MERVYICRELKSGMLYSGKGVRREVHNGKAMHPLTRRATTSRYSGTYYVPGIVLDAFIGTGAF